MYLTLPLPVQKKWKHTIFYVPWDVEKAHVKVWETVTPLPTEQPLIVLARFPSKSIGMLRSKIYVSSLVVGWMLPLTT